MFIKKTQVFQSHNLYDMIVKICLNTMKSHIGKVGSVKKEKPVPSTPSAPGASPPHSESKDLLEGLNPNPTPSPLGSKTPKQETEIESCSAEEKQNVHTGTLNPKPEVCMLDYSSDWPSAAL